MSTVPAVPGQLIEALPNLLAAVDEGMGGDYSRPALLLRFETDDAGVALGIKELAAGQHPLDVLMGFVAPDEWAAIGVVCHGWASNNLSGTRPSRAADRRRIRTLHVVTREGAEVSGFRTAEDAAVAWQSEAVGMVPDALKRCLGLPTPSAHFPAAGLSAADWIDAVLDDPLAADCPPDPYSHWDEVRWEVITRVRRVDHITSTVATWMDAGMFARAMATTYPRTADHLAALRRATTPDVATRVTDVLGEWAVL